ncbi:MAG: DUF3488 domain-containing protein [Betaproteobacteria bacterium HGW-Betaproteobacteria-13]|nr:MAG: DUF3488 domain-containing protein [Betaproteobacteria bacterium HGW-Betaproteobacteria-13]
MQGAAMFRRRTGTPPQASAEAALRRDQGAWLLSAAALTLAPHLLTLPLWVSALSVLLLSWRASLLWQGGRTQNTYVTLLIAIAAGIGVRVAFGHFFGKDPGLAFLALLLGLKLLETSNMRDIRAAILLCFFLQLGVFFDNQSLLSIGALLSLSDPAAGTRERLRTSALLLAQGLPFMLVLFVLFPRIEGPLWGLPADAHSGMSGLSDTMAPGSISDLSLSEAIAFRAEFPGAPPQPAQRYWRGPVLSIFDGNTWRAARHPEGVHPPYVPTGPRIDYRITLEAHNQRWLLALDYPAEAPDGVRYSSAFQAMNRQPLRSRTRLDLAAYPETVVGLDEPARVLDAALHLPPDSNPRTRALAQELAIGSTSPEDTLARALARMREIDLTYTLRPPLTGTNGVDAFLFDTRRGFCEHFASAFVFLMRAAGVPARVVTGYQGGEINPVDGSMIVRQSDAHAWAEVWLPQRGWVRVDPTALAAPGRIESGMASALPVGEVLPLFMRPHLSWLRDLRFRWEAVSNSWNQWVLGYNPERQREFLSRLGLGELGWSTWIGILSVAAAGLMGLLFAWALRQARAADPLDRAWAAFSARLARRGLSRRPAEGPLDYGRRLAQALPEHAAEITDITTRYANLRYRPPASPKAVRELKRRIRILKLT